MSFNTDTWCTPSGQLKLVKKLWTSGIALDPFYNKNSKVKARKYYDLKKKQDAYKLPWKNKTFANGPYSGKNPQRTVERCCVFAEKGFSILNLCPAAPGSVYWYEYVWGCAAAIAWLGRLAFEAPCNIYDEDGKLLYKKGEEIKGNRTEIAMILYSSDKKEIKAFQRIWEEAGYPVSILTKDSKIEALRAANPTNLSLDEYAEIWQDIFRRDRLLSWDASQVAKEFSAKTGLEFLGSGLTRGVFALSDDRVLKLAIDQSGNEANLTECAIWKNAHPKQKYWLAPIYECARDGAWLIMARAEVVPKLDTDTDAYEGNVVVRDLGILDTGLPEQWGDLNGRMVLIDYGQRGEEFFENPNLLKRKLLR